MLNSKQYSFLVALLIVVGFLCVTCIVSSVVTIKKQNKFFTSTENSTTTKQQDSIGDYVLFELNHINPVGSIMVLDSVIAPSSIIKYVVNTDCGGRVIYTTVEEYVDCCIWVEAYHHCEFAVSNFGLSYDGTRKGLMDSMLDMYHHIIAYIHFDMIGDRIVLRNDWVRLGRHGECTDYEIHKYLVSAEFESEITNSKD